MPEPGPFRGGQVHVLAGKCRTCVFRPGNLMRLRPGRLKQIVADNVAAQSALTCHSTLYAAPAPPAICRGFWDRYQAQVWPLRLAVAMGMVVFDPLPADEPGAPGAPDG
jgi:hypothetical protein